VGDPVDVCVDGTCLFLFELHAATSKVITGLGTAVHLPCSQTLQRLKNAHQVTVIFMTVLILEAALAGLESPEGTFNSLQERMVELYMNSLVVKVGTQTIWVAR